MNSVERVDEIRRRVSAASPPPWAAFWEGRDHLGGSHFIMLGAGDERGEDIEIVSATLEDYDFIAYARVDIVELLRAWDSLQATIPQDESKLSWSARCKAGSIRSSQRHHLRSIRERAAAATPAPWVSRPPANPRPVATGATAAGDTNFLVYGCSERDYDFIVNIRQDIPFLLDEIERLFVLVGI